MSPEFIDFLQGLATDPDKLAGYIDDPESTLTGSGLADDEKEILRNNDFSKVAAPYICFVVVMAPGPMSDI